MHINIQKGELSLYRQSPWKFFDRIFYIGTFDGVPVANRVFSSKRP